MPNTYLGKWLDNATPGMRVILSQKNEAFFEVVTLCQVSSEHVFIRRGGNLIAFDRRTTRTPGLYRAKSLKIMPYNEELLTWKVRERTLNRAREAIDAFPVGLMTEKEAMEFIEELHNRSKALMDRHYACHKMLRISTDR